MNTALALSVGMARSWVALYTVRLPLDIKESRRSEIDSDLWEQQWLASRQGAPPFGTAIEVLTRMLLGIISDITWRVQANAPARPDRGIQMKNEALYMRGIVAVGVVLGFVLIVAGIGATVDALLDPDTADGEAVVNIVFAIAGAAVLFGLLSSRRNPVLGIGLVAVGSITAAVIFYWLFMITIPVGITLVAIAVFRARSTGWPSRAGTGLPTGTGAA